MLLNFEDFTFNHLSLAKYMVQSVIYLQQETSRVEVYGDEDPMLSFGTAFLVHQSNYVM